MATIELKNLSKYFQNVCAVRDVNLRIEDKEFLTLLGPSGCGKTTTLNMIAGLEKPTQGEIYIDGHLVNQVSASRRDVAMVFQTYALYPHMTVRENMAFALKIRKVQKEAIETKVNEAAEILEIKHMLDRRPRQLSGGQRQRVALGRAIVRNPKAFLLDEPLSNLDAALRVQMRAELKMIFNRLEATAVYVTHDQVEAMTMSNRIAIFNAGVIQQVATPLDIYYRPANRFVASFVGSPSINLVAGRLEEAEGQLVVRTPDLELGLQSRQQEVDLLSLINRSVILGIRPEDFALATGEQPSTTSGKLEVIERMGSSTILYLNIGHQLVTVEMSGNLQAQLGDKIRLILPPDRIYIFDQESNKTVLFPSSTKAVDKILK
jgi:multiple sugar transport system ATP-binding protein